jgi:Phage tail tube protein, GTA-gp10
MNGLAMNPVRGEARVAGFHVRPTFAALVAAEAEVGPLFALVERAAGGTLSLADMVALFWHCRVEGVDISRADFAEEVTAAGLSAATPALKTVLGQILQGR